MRYLILGDVHGNLPALETVLAKEKGNYEVLVSHGDVVNYGPWSNECVDLLDAYSNAILLTGNHEEYFLKNEYTGTHPVARAFFDFNIAFFDRREQIAQYKQELKLSDFIVRHTLGYKYIFKDTAVTIDGNYIIGHSHQQFYREIGGYKLINTGSVGQNREFINEINYVIYDDESGIVDLKSIIYDHSVVINEFRKRQYPDICIEYYLNKKTKKILT